MDLKLPSKVVYNYIYTDLCVYYAKLLTQAVFSTVNDKNTVLCEFYYRVTLAFTRMVLREVPHCFMNGCFKN